MGHQSGVHAACGALTRSALCIAALWAQSGPALDPVCRAGLAQVLHATCAPDWPCAVCRMHQEGSAGHMQHMGPGPGPGHVCVVHRLETHSLHCGSKDRALQAGSGPWAVSLIPHGQRI